MPGQGKRLLITLLAGALAVTGGLWTPIGGADTSDPCSDTTDASTAGKHVCLDGETIAIAPRTAANAVEHSEVDTTYVRFDVEDAGRYVVLQGEGEASDLVLDPENWTDPLPSNATDAEPNDPDGLARVHLLTPLTPAWSRDLNDMGVRILTPYGQNWYLANVSDAAEGWTQDRTYIDLATDFDTDQKIEEALLNITGDVRVNVIAMPHTPGAFSNVEAAILTHGGNITRTAPDPGIAEAILNASVLPSLAESPSVLWVGFGSNTTNYHNDKVREMTQIESVRNITDPPLAGQGIKGMISDGVLDRNHEELNSSLTHAHNESLREPPDNDRHGTQVFGIVFADGDPEGEVTNPAVRGMAPEADGIFWQKARLRRWSHAQHAVQDHQASFASYSWGQELPGTTVSGVKINEAEDGAYDAFSWETDFAAWNLDLFVVQSMGNAGSNGMASEAAAKNPASIGGIYHEDTSDFSDDHWDDPDCTGCEASIGATTDGRIKPDMAAPNDWILTTDTCDCPSSDDLDTTTPRFEGTSASAPIVAGAGALVQQMYNESVFGNATLSPTSGIPSGAMTKALVVNSGRSYSEEATEVPPEEQELNRPRHMRDVQGWGLPQVLDLYDDGGHTATVDGSVDLATGSRFSLTYDLPNETVELRATLVWAEPPSAPFAPRILSDDLDLQVQAPNGSEYVGNHGLRNSGYSNSTPAPLLDADRLNNVENVIVPVNDTRSWTVSVTAFGVQDDAVPETPGPHQDFALVVRPVIDDGDSGCDCESGAGSGDAVEISVFHPEWRED